MYRSRKKTKHLKYPLKKKNNFQFKNIVCCVFLRFLNHLNHK